MAISAEFLSISDGTGPKTAVFGPTLHATGLDVETRAQAAETTMFSRAVADV
jgi:hypothetical protein